LQALYLLNDAFVHQQAAGLEKRIRSERSTTSERLELAYLLILGRKPGLEDSEAATRFLTDVQQKFASTKVPDDQLESQSWQALIRAMFRLNEFVYID
jgi:hypothetical protein